MMTRLSIAEADGFERSGAFPVGDEMYEAAWARVAKATDMPPRAYSAAPKTWADEWRASDKDSENEKFWGLDK